MQRLGIGNAIYKSLSATDRPWRETRLLREPELGLMENLRYAPVIFQRYIECNVDLRITVVGDQVFAAAIHSQETGYKVDFRMEVGKARIEPMELPEGVRDGLLWLMRQIDIRRRPDGTQVFLEVNTASQWQFVEQATGQPIARAMASLLRRHDGQASGGGFGRLQPPAVQPPLQTARRLLAIRCSRAIGRAHKRLRSS